jgi:hypothetical protein
MAAGRKCLREDKFFLLILPIMTKYVEHSGAPVICTGFPLLSALVAAILLLLLLLLLLPLLLIPLVLVVSGECYYNY